MTAGMKDDTERHPVTPYLCRFLIYMCVNVMPMQRPRLGVCVCLCNICMSGISMHIYAYVRVGCVHTRVHLSAHGIRVCVSVCGRDKDMKEEGPPWCLYVTQRWRGNDSSLSPTQARQRRSTADFSCFSAFFLTLSFRNVAKASVTASPSLSLSESHTHTLFYARLLTGVRLALSPFSPSRASHPLNPPVPPPPLSLYLPHASCLTPPTRSSCHFSPPAARCQLVILYLTPLIHANAHTGAQLSHAPV